MPPRRTGMHKNAGGGSRKEETRWVAGVGSRKGETRWVAGVGSCKGETRLNASVESRKGETRWVTGGGNTLGEEMKCSWREPVKRTEGENVREDNHLKEENGVEMAMTRAINEEQE